MELVGRGLVADELFFSGWRLRSRPAPAEGTDKGWYLLPGELLNHVSQREDDAINELGFLVE